MAHIIFEVTRNGQVTQLQEEVGGDKISDLMKSLKTMKESSNDALTKLLQEENAKNSRTADEKEPDTDEEEEQPKQEEPRKKLKS